MPTPSPSQSCCEPPAAEDRHVLPAEPVIDDTRFITRLIDRVARRLVYQKGLTRDDVPDIKQDMWLDLLERLPGYRPDLGHYRAFVSRVVKNKAASILESRAASKRGNGRPCRSLSEEFEDEDGEETEFQETISVDDYLRRTRGTIRTEEERLDLAGDIRQLLDQLPAHHRVVCLLLIDRDVTDIANVVGVPRSTLRDAIKRLQRLGEKSGLKDYRK